jgi:hypothetical protein
MRTMDMKTPAPFVMNRAGIEARTARLARPLGVNLDQKCQIKSIDPIRA